MHINSLLLTNFRNYEKYSIDFNQTTIFIGLNGIGKTNILEAIWFLADGRSWRTSKDLELIRWDKDYLRIEAKLKTSIDEKQIELFVQKNPSQKSFKINGVKKRLIDLLGQMPAVLFSPETIEMVDGAPALRRKFLDIMLSQVDHHYALDLLEYQKILRRRNHLLLMIKQNKSQNDELDFWDEEISLHGEKIIKKRKEAVSYINRTISRIYQDISGTKEKMALKYHETVNEIGFNEHLAGIREREIEQSSTLIGPHRDDLSFLLNEKNINTFGSRGEYRSAVLAVKILELQYLESKLNESPILLLDDIFSELDAKRRMHLNNIIANHQTIITTTDLDHIDKNLRQKAKIVELG